MCAKGRDVSSPCTNPVRTTRHSRSLCSLFTAQRRPDALLAHQSSPCKNPVRTMRHSRSLCHNRNWWASTATAGWGRGEGEAGGWGGREAGGRGGRAD